MSGFTPKGEHEDTVDTLVNVTLEGQPVHKFPDPAYIAELETDRERLEWLVGTSYRICRVYPRGRQLRDGFGRSEGPVCEDWRAAIDEAMKAEG